jgi:hypothetical protein
VAGGGDGQGRLDHAADHEMEPVSPGHGHHLPAGLLSSTPSPTAPLRNADELGTLLAALWIYPGAEAAIFLTYSAAALILALRVKGAPGRLDVVAHCSFAVTGWVFVMTSSGTDPAWFSGLLGGRLFRLGALTMAAVVSIQLAGPARTIYQSAVYLGLLLWSYSTFHPMSNGAGLVSAAWTVQGAVALMTAVRQESQLLQFKGLGTIALVAAKMLLFDLSELDPVWRILLFMGFGVGLLSLAWHLNRAGSAGGEKPAREAAGEPWPVE